MIGPVVVVRLFNNSKDRGRERPHPLLEQARKSELWSGDRGREGLIGAMEGSSWPVVSLARAGRGNHTGRAENRSGGRTGDFMAGAWNGIIWPD
jgi:hypothetical protein